MNTHDAWEKIHQNKKWGVYPSEHVIRFIARNYYSKDRKNTKILDFGCGTGAHTWYLAREGFDTFGFDISETTVQSLKEYLLTEKFNAHVQVMDGLNLSYEDNFFDAVIDNVSIQSNCTNDIIGMYKKVYNVLKTNGRFMTVVFGKETTGYGTGKEIKPGTYEGVEKGALQGYGCRHFFDEDELYKMLENVGFKNIHIEFILFSDKGNVNKQFIAIGEK